MLLFVEIFGFADGRYRSAQIAFDFIADGVPGADLAQAETGLFEAKVGDRVCAQGGICGWRGRTAGAASVGRLSRFGLLDLFFAMIELASL